MKKAPYLLFSHGRGTEQERASFGRSSEKKNSEYFVSKGQFISLPAYKENGHSIFRGDLNAWKNDFEKFIKEIGF
jgi:hypothetical protein